VCCKNAYSSLLPIISAPYIGAARIHRLELNGTIYFLSSSYMLTLNSASKCEFQGS